MPRGPKGEKRPGDVIGAAVMVGRIATGEIDQTETLPDGKARAEGMTAKRRKEIAKKWRKPAGRNGIGLEYFNLNWTG
jgi:hypothetical protein